MSTTQKTTNLQQKTIFPSEPLTQEEELEYIEAFSLFDRDEDGLINPRELSILIRSLECNPTDNEIHHLVSYIADEGNNLIDRNQFLVIMSVLKKNHDADERKELREIFNGIDTDNNGLIDSEELRVAMRLLTIGHDEIKLTKEELDHMIAEVDGNKDGRINFDEFASIFPGQTS